MLDFDLEPYSDASGWYVALSGGIDSMVLMHCILALRHTKPRSFPDLSAIHINHGLHKDADLWEAHCINFCEKNNVPIHVERIKFKNEGYGVENAAREHRYRAFEHCLPPFSVLFVGHHRDDQVETFFLRLLRGSGSKGLTSIPHERSLGQSTILRPMLGFSRVQIEAYASANNITGVFDSSNEDTTFDRNFLRHSILPLLESRWPGYRSTIGRAISILNQDNQLLDSLLPTNFNITNIFGDPGLSLEFVSKYGAHAARIIIRRFVVSHGLFPPNLSPLNEFVRQLKECNDEATPEISFGRNVIRRFRDGIYIVPTFSNKAQFSVVNLSPGQSVNIKGIGLLQLSDQKDAFNSSGFTGEVKFCWRNSEVVEHSKKLRSRVKKLLNREDIPPWWRDRVPIAFLDEKVLGIGRPGRVEINMGDGARFFFDWFTH